MGRYGGEEFVMLLVETCEEGALVAAERIREKITKLAMKVEEGIVFVTASLGIAALEDGDAEMVVETLMERADQAMYASKRAGRNRVAMWQKDM
jgi:diguanylate cyclase (GGDEF)-like protein